MPSVMAGLKCSFLMRSKGGVSKGEVQAPKSGLPAVEEEEVGFASSPDFSPVFWLWQDASMAKTKKTAEIAFKIFIAHSFQNWGQKLGHNLTFLFFVA